MDKKVEKYKKYSVIIRQRKMSWSESSQEVVGLQLKARDQRINIKCAGLSRNSGVSLQ